MQSKILGWKHLTFDQSDEETRPVTYTLDRNLPICGHCEAVQTYVATLFPDHLISVHICCCGSALAGEENPMMEGSGLEGLVNLATYPVRTPYNNNEIQPDPEARMHKMKQCLPKVEGANEVAD